MNREAFSLGVHHMTVSKLLEISSGNMSVVISAESRRKIRSANDAVLKIANGERAVYGINTGFGPLCTSIISKEETAILQEKLLISHSVGVGEYISVATSKMMLILKLHALCQGFSGASEVIVDRILWHILEDVIPAVPSQGSVGASGDLAPLAHLFLPLIGRGMVHIDGEYVTALEAFQKYDLRQVKLGPKDILSLINGTQFISAHAAQLAELTLANLRHADLIGAMMVDGLMGSKRPFSADLHALRPYPANIHTAARLTTFLTGSEINESHVNCSLVQDPYSLRCMPQVHGASRNSWLHMKEALEIEMNSVTDNPVVFSEDYTISGGNFHGQPMALPIDYICLANAEIGSISDRRMYLALEGRGSVPKLLMEETGLNSGFMILQYTAAALASENKSHSFPASADSIVTSLGQEDHVSMGSIGVRKALKVAENTQKILGIELMCAAQAMEFHRPLKSSGILEKIHASVRNVLAFSAEDRLFADDMNAAIDLLASRKIIEIEKTHKNDKYSEYDDLFEIY